MQLGRNSYPVDLGLKVVEGAKTDPLDPIERNRYVYGLAHDLLDLFLSVLLGSEEPDKRGCHEGEAFAALVPARIDLPIND
jgi:hypothetical protein